MKRDVYERKRKEISEEYCRKLKELYDKYSQPLGVLDGGPPKEEEAKLRNELFEKWDNLEKEYYK